MQIKLLVTLNIDDDKYQELKEAGENDQDILKHIKSAIQLPRYSESSLIDEIIDVEVIR